MVSILKTLQLTTLLARQPEDPWPNSFVPGASQRVLKPMVNLPGIMKSDQETNPGLISLREIPTSPLFQSTSKPFVISQTRLSDSRSINGVIHKKKKSRRFSQRPF